MGDVIIRQELGNGFGRGGVFYQGENWALKPNEKGDLQNIQVNIAENELKHEQDVNNSFVDYNTFVDGSQFKKLNQVKFGGRIEFNEVSALGDLILFLQEKIYIMIMNEAYKTGDYSNSIVVKRNGTTVGSGGVPILDKGDQLVIYTNVFYAKYQEVGYRGIKGKWILKRAAALARARFGKGFIIEHKMLQTVQIPPTYVQAFRSTKTGRVFHYQKFSEDYYKQRWAVSYPAIKITQRQGVKFYV